MNDNKEDFCHGHAIYVGDEFPESVGETVKVWDDHTNPNAPCYKIQFVGSTEIIENIDDNDLDWNP